MAVFSGFVFGRCLYVFGCFHVFRMMFSCQCSVSDGRWIVPPPEDGRSLWLCKVSACDSGSLRERGEPESGGGCCDPGIGEGVHI